MIVFISPAKGFNETDIKANSIPSLIDKSKIIMNELKSLSEDDIKKSMKVNDKIAELNVRRFSNFRFDSEGIPAIFGYSGIQYKNIDAASFSEDDINFLEKHFRILSGLYGVLKPMDSIYPYRLDLLTKISVEGSKNLYEFWNSSIYEKLSEESPSVIVNLASDEYSKAVKKYAENQKYVSCTFKVDKSGKLKVESTASKIARGKMVRFIVENRIDDPEQLKTFNLDGYIFREDLSSDDEFVFVIKK